MLLLFALGIVLILLCAVKVWRLHGKQQYAVLLVAYAWPINRLEQALYTFDKRFTANCRHWYVYLPQTSAADFWQAANLLARRLGFSLLSAGECRRMRQSKDYQFYFLSEAGVLYCLGVAPAADWQQLFTL